MGTSDWILIKILPIFGFIFVLALLVFQNNPRRSSSSTIAWLLTIVLVPWVGVPAYIAIGRRKLKKLTQGKKSLVSGKPTSKAEIISMAKGSIFPLALNNSISLLASGEKAFSSLMSLIENAKDRIDIATYILSNDETGKFVLAALAKKAAEGIRIRLLLDALGSFGLPTDVFGPLTDHGGRYAYFMPMVHLPFRGRANLRNHRKMVLVDRRIAIVGGMNIAQEYMGPNTDEQRWHDLSFLVSGSSVQDMQCIFNSDWNYATKQETIDDPLEEKINNYAKIQLQVVPSGPDVSGDPLYEKVLSMLFTAKQRLWIVTPYFIPDEMLIKAMCIAAKRGIDIRIVVPQVSNHRIADMVRRSFLRQMQECGATVYMFKQGMMHGKAILVDNNLAIVGSMNMDVRSFFLNYEIALYIYDASVVLELDAWVNKLIGKSSVGIKSTTVFGEMIEACTRLFSPLL